MFCCSCSSHCSHSLWRLFFQHKTAILNICQIWHKPWNVLLSCLYHMIHSGLKMYLAHPIFFCLFVNFLYEVVLDLQIKCNLYSFYFYWRFFFFFFFLLANRNNCYSNNCNQTLLIIRDQSFTALNVFSGCNCFAVILFSVLKQLINT